MCIYNPQLTNKDRVNKNKEKRKPFPTKRGANPRSHWQYKIYTHVLTPRKNINCIYTSCQTSR